MEQSKVIKEDDDNVIKECNETNETTETTENVEDGMDITYRDIKHIDNNNVYIDSIEKIKCARNKEELKWMHGLFNGASVAENIVLGIKVRVGILEDRINQYERKKKHL